MPQLNNRDPYHGPKARALVLHELVHGLGFSIFEMQDLLDADGAGAFWATPRAFRPCCALWCLLLSLGDGCCCCWLLLLLLPLLAMAVAVVVVVLLLLPLPQPPPLRSQPAGAPAHASATQS
eukprot:SAG11_NODE_4902_length_1729_cov_2.017791_1_plen_122_part_00